MRAGFQWNRITLTLRNLPRRLWRFLVRMDVAVILILLALLIASLGSCFPQQSPALQTDSERLALWEQSARDRYGALTNLLSTLGVFKLYKTLTVTTLAVLLTISSLVCTLDHWRAIWRRAFHREIRCSEATIQAAPHTARLIGLEVDGLDQMLHECLLARGFRVRSKEIQGSLHIRGDRYRLGVLATLSSHLGVVLLALGTLLTSWLSWEEEITVNSAHPAKISHLSNAVLHYEALAIDRYPDGSAADYKAEVRLMIGKEIAAIGVINPNNPLTYRGIGIYLKGFTASEGEYTVTFLTALDPGFGFVIVAGFLVLLGMSVSFNFPHCCIQARLEPEGTLLLAGRADRRACDFEQEFTVLVQDLRRRLETQ